MERKEFVVRLKPSDMERYKELDADVWPKVLDKKRDCNIRNYSIFLHEPEQLLFGHYEYCGSDHQADMDKMAADPATQDWWSICKPLMEPVPDRKADEFWAEMNQIFFMEK